MANINGVNNSGSTGRVNKSKTTKVKKTKAASAPADEDQLHLSVDAVLFNDLQAALRDVPDVDVEKIEQIRQAIKDGSLPMDRDRLAKKMLELQEELKDL